MPGCRFCASANPSVFSSNILTMSFGEFLRKTSKLTSSSGKNWEEFVGENSISTLSRKV